MSNNNRNEIDIKELTEIITEKALDEIRDNLFPIIEKEVHAKLGKGLINWFFKIAATVLVGAYMFMQQKGWINNG